MFDEVLGAIFGRKDSVSHRQLLNVAKREAFSDFLPYITYCNSNKNFTLTDNTTAYMWEITPLVYQGPKQTAALEGIIRQPFPEGTVMQYLMFPDRDIEFVVDHYQRSKTRFNEIGTKAVEETAKFFREATSGLKNTRGVPVRNFRAFVILKSNDDLSDFIQTVQEMLSAANLNPRVMDDFTLVSLLDKIINNGDGKRHINSAHAEPHIYSRDKALRERIISNESVIDWHSERYPIIGNRFMSCLTAKDTGISINPTQTNNMFGGIMGVEEDSQQHNYDYFYSVNIVYTNPDEELSTKASLTMGQKAVGSFSQKLNLRIKDFVNFRADQAKNIKYLKVIPTLWICANSVEQMDKNIGRAKMIWARSESGTWTLEKESILNQALFIASLPGGLYNVGKNVNLLDRHIYMSAQAAARFVPVQGDYCGNGSPVTLMVGRKGQIIGLDVFAPGSPNHNFLVCAESGGGKSFFLNTVLFDNYSQGSKVRVVDIGRSYEKLCKSAGGKFIDLRIDSNDQCINPMDFIVKRNAEGEIDQTDVQGNLSAASLVFAEMVYSKSKAVMPEHEYQLIKDATTWAYLNGRTVEGTDAIYHYLRNYAALTKSSADYLEALVDVAERMAYCLKDFTSAGPYGKFFVGKTTIRIRDDDFVVVELDDIKGDPELFSVVVIQMMNEITQDLYLSDRKQPRFILFEEAPSLLKENGNADLSRLGEMVDEGYRRARKYGGAFGLVMQSIMDVNVMGKAGKSALSNASYKFMLSAKSDQYNRASAEKIIGYEGFALNLLNSLKNNKPHYSEIFLETPQGNGIGRLVVDKFRYLISTTEAHEVAIFNEALSRGYTPLQATLAIRDGIN